MQATDPVFYGGTINGVLTLNGRIACSGVTGRKIDIYNDGSTIYGFGLNDFEYCVFGGQGSAFTYRIATPGATDLAGEIALFVNATGVGIPVGRPISWGSNTLLVDATGALLVNGAPLTGGGGSYNPAAVAITGGTIDNVAGGFTSLAAPSLTATGASAAANLVLSAKGGGAVIAYANNAPAFSMGASVNAANYVAAFAALANNAPSLSAQGTDANITLTLAGKGTGPVLINNADIDGGTIDNTAIGNITPLAGRFTTLALTGSQTSKFVLIAPNAANGAPTWRQILATDISGLGALATADPAAPPALGGTTANTGRFSTLTHTGFLLRSMATGLTASTTNTQAGALGLTASVNNITTAAANSAVRLPNAAPAAGTAAEIIVRNGGANAVNCFPATGAAINALAANAAFSLAAGASARFYQLSATLYITA